MAEIPGDEVIDLVDGRDGNVDGVGDIFTVKDAAVDVAVSEYGNLVGELELVERFDEVEAAGAIRFGDAFDLTLDHDRAARTVLRKFMLPPAYRQIAPERFSVVQICTDDGGFEIEAEFHLFRLVFIGLDRDKGHF